MCNDKNGQAGRLATSEAMREFKPGLVYEARKLCQKLGLPDPCSVKISAERIAEYVKAAAREEMWESIMTSKYVRAEVKTAGNFPSYLYMEELSNHQQKVALCYRLGLLEFKTRFSGKYSNVRCIYDCEENDTLEHSLLCPMNPVKRPKNKENLGEMIKYLTELHRVRMEEVGVPLYYL